MWTSNIINRSPDDPPTAPLISLTRPSPPLQSIFENFFPLRQHAVMCYLASSSIPGTRINFLVSWLNLDKGGGGGRYHRRPFQQQMIKTSPFLEFQIDRSLFRMKGGIWAGAGGILSLLWSSIDKNGWNRWSSGVLDALGGQFIQTPSSMLRRRCFHENLFICFNQQRFIGLRQRYEVRFFSSAINTLKLILYSYTLIGNNLLALFICVIYFCDCSSFSSKKRSYPKIHME